MKIRAANLSSIGNRNGNKPIVFSVCSYDNFINILTEKNPGENLQSWFDKRVDFTNETYYLTNITIRDFECWIDGGMND